jgi:predicted ATPase
MESIQIQNFLVLKKIDIEIREINVIIGPQANGKSLIAKLVYFFRSISTDFIKSISAQKTKRELDKKMLLDFESRFPRYSWDGADFTISYKIDSIDVSVIGKKNARGKTNLAISYSEVLTKFFNSKKRLFQKKLLELNRDKSSSRNVLSEHMIMQEVVLDPLKKEDFSPFFSGSEFIPASRSFFANLQKNIFTFLASNLDIDPFLKEFGSLYQQSKRFYNDPRLFGKDKKKLFNELRIALESIANGDYEYHDEQDWIVSKGKKVNLANASSGQQESLPMLLVLCVWPMLRAKDNGEMFFIEEPEAHLFPTSQGYIVSILSTLYANMGTKFFITTHSPYILSALNNFCVAKDAVNSGRITTEDFVKLNGSGLPIQFEDISAYTIINGYSESISDNEYRIIGGELLDGISEHFEHVMNELLVSGE